ncbi:Minichromosome loss protein 1 [Smittium mucronatum]|uniref:Minichromosome loss protein 1 n=1 Tax=Smittium mucronatum TaxID=133383 RepID=A0A1R0GRT3_9FUNG|nr:Minichromosome loss protein 1 [Smittium mucronatum]
MSGISAPRFVHAEGYTTICFSSNGQFLISGGSDSLIRIFHNSTKYRNLEAKTLEYHSDSILSLSPSDDLILSSDEEGKVLSLSVSKTLDETIEADVGGTVFSSSLPIWDIKASPNGMQVAISTEEGEIYIVSLLDKSVLSQKKCHQGPINSIDYNNSGSKIVSCGNDGTVKIWDTSGTELECIHSWEKFSVACQPGEAEKQIKVRWQPHGNLIAIPGKNGEIVLVDSDSFEQKYTLESSKDSKVTSLAWSPNGVYLASASGKTLSLWNSLNKKLINQHLHNEEICIVTWHPIENQIAFSDTLGAVVIWDDTIDLQDKESPSMGIHPTREVDNLKGSTFIDDESFEDDIEIDGDDSVSKSGYNKIPRDSYNKNDSDFSDDGMSDFIVDDVNEKSNRSFKKSLGVEKVVPFQPSATPWLGNKCYLTFNTTGSVISTKVDESNNSIEIEFFDKSLHKDIRFSDPYKFSMSSLSNLGCLFGINPSISDINYGNRNDDPSLVDTGSSSFILYRAFKGWAGQSDWSFKFENREYIRCLSLSDNGAAIYTSANLIRFLSVGGVQVWVESVTPNILCCVSKDNLLFSIYQINKSDSGSYKSSSSANGCSYEWDLRKVSDGEKVMGAPLPVSSDSVVTWCGFSEEGLPLVCDSEGILRCLTRFQSGTSGSWVPVFDANLSSKQRGKKESYWPVGSFDSKFLVAILRGNSSYPPIPRPILSELDFQIPLLHSVSNTSSEEQKYLVKSITDKSNSFVADPISSNEDLDSENMLELDKLLLSSINAACKSEKNMRALDLVMMLHRNDSLEAAEKIAVFHKNEALAQRIIKIRSSRLRNKSSKYQNEDRESGNEGNLDNDVSDSDDESSNDSGVEIVEQRRMPSRKLKNPSSVKVDNGKNSQYTASSELGDSLNGYPDSLLADKGSNNIRNLQESDLFNDEDSEKQSHLKDSLLKFDRSSEIQRKRNANMAFNPFAVKNVQTESFSMADSNFSGSTASESSSYSGKKSKTQELLKPNSFNPFDPPFNGSPLKSSGDTMNTKGSEKSAKTKNIIDHDSYKPSAKNQTLLASFAHSPSKKTDS